MEEAYASPSWGPDPGAGAGLCVCFDSSGPWQGTEGSRRAWRWGGGLGRGSTGPSSRLPRPWPGRGSPLGALLPGYKGRVRCFVPAGSSPCHQLLVWVQGGSRATPFCRALVPGPCSCSSMPPCHFRGFWLPRSGRGCGLCHPLWFRAGYQGPELLIPVNGGLAAGSGCAALPAHGAAGRGHRQTAMASRARSCAEQPPRGGLTLSCMPWGSPALSCTQRGQGGMLWGDQGGLGGILEPAVGTLMAAVVS